MMKRVLLFLITNVLVIATLSTLTSVLGLHGYLTAYGLDIRALTGFCLVWGMGGAVISLLMSRWIAKMAMRLELITPETAIFQEKVLLDTVYALARQAGLTTMPQVGIYNASELNAFATGPSRNKSLIAVSRGLLNGMTQEEKEGVLAHEISHIANGDMVTMTLIQGIINSFSLFLSRILAYAINMAWNRNGSDRESNSITTSYYMMTFVFDILFTILGSLVVAAFSRRREYRADQGGAHLVGNQKMIAALKRLQLGSTGAVGDTRVISLEPLKISRPKRNILAIFASHPDLTLRIKALSSTRV